MLLEQVLEELSISLASYSHEASLAAENTDEVIKNPTDNYIKKGDAQKKPSSKSAARSRWVAAVRAALLRRKPLNATQEFAFGAQKLIAPTENPAARAEKNPSRILRTPRPLPEPLPSMASSNAARKVGDPAPNFTPLATEDPTAYTTQESSALGKHELKEKEKKGSFNKGKVLQTKTSGPLTRDTTASNSQCLHRAAIVAKEIQVSNHGRLSAPALLANCLLSMISLADDDDDDDEDDVHQITNHRHSFASHYHHPNHMHTDTFLHVNHHVPPKSSHHRSSSAHGSMHKEHHIHEIIHHRPSSVTAQYYHDEHDVHEIVHYRHSSVAHYHDQDHNKPMHDHDVHICMASEIRHSSATNDQNGLSSSQKHPKSSPADTPESDASTLSAAESAMLDDMCGYSVAKPSYCESATHRNHKLKMERFSCCLLGCGGNHSSKSMGSTIELLDHHSAILNSYDPHLHKTNSFNGAEVQGHHQDRAMWGSCDLGRMVKRALFCYGVTETENLHHSITHKADGQARHAAAGNSKAALIDPHSCCIGRDDQLASFSTAAGNSKNATKDNDRAIRSAHGNGAVAESSAGGDDQVGDEGTERNTVQGALASHDVTVAATFVFSSSSSSASSSSSSRSLKILHENAVHPWLAALSPSPGLALLPAASPSARHSADDIMSDHAHLVAEDDLHVGLISNKSLNSYTC